MAFKRTRCASCLQRAPTTHRFRNPKSTPKPHQAKNSRAYDRNNVDTIRTFLSLFHYVDPFEFLLLFWHVLCYQGAEPPTVASIPRTSDSTPTYPPRHVHVAGFAGFASGANLEAQAYYASRSESA